MSSIIHDEYCCDDVERICILVALVEVVRGILNDLC